MVKQSSIAIYGINYRPEPTGIGPYTAELAEELVKTGSKVRVITTFAHYPQWKVAEGDRRRWRRKEVINGVKVTRLWSHMPRPMTGLQRMLFELSYLGSALFHGPGDAETVVGISPGLGSGLAAAIHAKLRKKRLVVVVQDLAGRGLSQSGLSSAEMLGKIARTAERLFLTSAHVVIVISYDFVAQILEMGVASDRIIFLPNWERNASPGSVRSRSLDGPKRLVHAGSMGIKQGLYQMIDLAAVAQSLQLPWTFTLVGDGSERQKLQAMSQSLKNVEIFGPVSVPEHAELLADADLLLLFQAPTNIDMSFPSKLASYLSSGTPVAAVVPVNSAVARVLTEANAGLVLRTGQDLFNVQALVQFLGNNDLQKIYAQAGLIYSNQTWGKHSVLSQWTASISGHGGSGS